MTGTTQTEIAVIDKERMYEAVEILLEARRKVRPIHDLPEELRPRSLAEAYYAQDLMAEAYGDVGGWKVGASAPDVVPVCAPMPFYTFAKNGTLISKEFRRMRGVEAEIAFLMKQDLPRRPQPYSREEVIDAIESCHPAIEILETGIADPDRADRLTVIADLAMNGGFIYGEAITGWKDFDFSTESAEMQVDGVVRAANGTSPLAGDLLRLVVWLSNDGWDRTGGRLAGKWITTGSWTGNVLAERGSEAIARFKHCGSVSVRFE